jgi:hypothetical protein
VQPLDVYWTNLKISNEERASTLSQSYVVLIILLLFSLGILVGVEEVQFAFGRKMGEGDVPDLPDIDQITSSVPSIPDSFNTDNLEDLDVTNLK